MKLTRLAIACAALAAAAASAQTTVNSGTFSVTVSTTPVCGIQSSASNVDFGAYTPFTNAAVTPAATNMVFRCSQGITPTAFGFERVTGTASDMTVSTAGTGAATAEGVIRGLRYTLAMPALATALTSAGQAATAGAGGTGGTNSSARVYTFPVTAAMAGGQAASSTVGDTTQSWRVILTY